MKNRNKKQKNIKRKTFDDRRFEAYIDCYIAATENHDADFFDFHFDPADFIERNLDQVPHDAWVDMLERHDHKYHYN